MKPADPSPSLRGRLAAAFSVKRVAVVALLCVLAAAALNPIFVSPFALLLGRTLLVGMALLTLVENAVRHGIDPSEEGGRIEVGGRRDDSTGSVTPWVADTGAGLAETAAPGTGLANLRARLQAVYGAEARLDLHEVAPHGLRAELVFKQP